MGVYIKGMDMPSDCDFCGFENTGYCSALLSYINVEEGIDTRCPLIEVKAPHGRLIDAEKAINDNRGIYDEAMIDELLNDKALPTVIEAEVE